MFVQCGADGGVLCKRSERKKTMKKRFFLITCLLMSVFLLGVMSGSAAGAIRYVDGGATGANNGSSWADAYIYLSDAISAAGWSDEIWVAAGIYKPDQSTAKPSGTRDRTATFRIKNLYGGFAGTETSRDQRDWRRNKTILDGDLNGDDTSGFAHRSDNSYHVASGGDYSNILDGFIIKGGCANASSGEQAYGGGISTGNATVQNCLLTDNLARFGGGYYGYGPLINCIFDSNKAYISGWDSNGGGIYYYGSEVYNCVFQDNYATWGSGAYCYGDGVTFVNCTFTGNDSSQSGNALYISTWFYGGANLSYLYNCIFWDNSASAHSIYLKSYPDGAIELDVYYCDIEGGSAAIETDGPEITINWEIGNITTDPLLVNGYRLSAGSPCIDAGDNRQVPADSTDLDSDGNTTESLPYDIDGKIRFFNDDVDMGASEYNGVIYVDADANGDDNGASWFDAFNYLQDALAAAFPGEQIWVAAGTYRPDQGDGYTVGNRNHSFELKNGVAINGGFAGKEISRNQRDWQTNETILSGDIGSTFLDRSYHVVTSSNIYPFKTATLDGFTISHGYANGTYPNNEGGGMYNKDSSPTVTNCTFSANWAGDGGGMYNDNSSPTVTNCIFRGNEAIHGGGIYSYNDSSPTLTNSIFSGNHAMYGGGLENRNADATLVNCTFSGNSADNYGGGINHLCDVGLSNTVTLTNCVLWGNTSDHGYQIALARSTLSVDYCAIQDEQEKIYKEASPTINWGTVNIGGDPLFVDADGPDDTFGTEDDNLRLLPGLPGSPCIDAGDNAAVPSGITTDLDGGTRFFNDPYTPDTGNGTPPIVDMGAYELDEDGMDTDEDGMDDVWEIDHFGDIVSSDGTGDPDDDNLTDLQEFQNNTEPNDEDTDDDDMQDGWEVGYGLDPLVNDAFDDADGDEFCNWREYLDWTDPANPADMPAPSTIKVDDDASGFENGTSIYPFDTIKEGIDFAGPHDTVQVANGTYTGTGNKNLDFKGKAITVQSKHGPEDCIIDCKNAGRGFHFHNGEGQDAVVSGFTITNGYGYDGGAIRCTDSSSPSIINCIILGNESTDDGGAVYCHTASPIFINCIISSNETLDDGGGVHLYNSSPSFINCSIAYNSADSSGGGVNVTGSSSPELTNCILWGNTPDQIAGASATVTYSDVQGGFAGAGNINQDPLLAAPNRGDYHLRSGSACIDAGNNTTVPGWLALDFEGDDRIIDGDNVPGAVVDMGADEYIDTDGDGVQDSEEMGPEGNDPDYDANGDGTRDSEQDNVASMHTYDGENYITLASPEETAMRNVRAVEPDDAPAEANYPHGFFGFEVHGLLAPGDCTEVTLFLPLNPNINTYWKYGRTHSDPTDHWYQFPYDHQTGAEIFHEPPRTRIVLHLCDNLRGDDDLDANSVIEGIGGPAITDVACESDFDQDGDVDGSDLAVFTAGGTTITLEDFAADFGRTNCP
jgi:hypothetical protein